MKNKSFGKHLIYTLIGLAVLALGAVLWNSTKEAKGIMQALSYIMIGIGAGIFGQNLGTAYSIYALKKIPLAAKQKEIEEKDERNITIRNKSKAKAYDLMVIVFGALIMSFALLEVNLTAVLAMVVAYVLVVLSNIYFLNKYNKEM